MEHQNSSLQERKLVFALLFGFLFTFLSGAVQTQDLIWARQAGGISLDLGSNIAVDTFGNCYVVGVFEGVATFGAGNNETTLTSVENSSIFIAKYGIDGSFLWAKQTGVSSPAEAWSEIAVDASGAIYITSPFYDTMTLGLGESNETTITSAGSEDIFIAKYNSEGMLLWAKQAGGVERNRSTEIAIDSSGHSYVSGFFSGSATFGSAEPNETQLMAAGASDIFLAKFGIDGSLVWARRDGGEGFDSGQGIAVDPSGNSHVMGAFEGSAIFGIGESNETTISAEAVNLFLAKYDTEGKLLWVAQSNGRSFVNGNRVALDAFGNSYVAGSFDGSTTFGPGESNEIMLIPAGASEIFIAKYDLTGLLLWAKQAGGKQYDLGYGLAVDASGNSHVTGSFEGTAMLGMGETNQTILTSVGNSDIFVASYNNDGSLLGARQAGSSQYDAGSGIAIGPSANIYVTGRFNASATFGDAEPNETILNSVGIIDMFVAKYGAEFPTNAEETSFLIDDFKLAQNYPNPFNSQTKIQYQLPKSSHVKLIILNVLGQKVATLIDKVQSAGLYSAIWDGTTANGNSVASGVYLYQITAGAYTTVKKGLLLK